MITPEEIKYKDILRYEIWLIKPDVYELLTTDYRAFKDETNT